MRRSFVLSLWKQSAESCCVSLGWCANGRALPGGFRAEAELVRLSADLSLRVGHCPVHVRMGRKTEFPGRLPCSRSTLCGDGILWRRRGDLKVGEAANSVPRTALWLYFATVGRFEGPGEGMVRG